jgi:hypothetical protein
LALRRANFRASGDSGTVSVTVSVPALGEFWATVTPKVEVPVVFPTV